MTSPIDPIRRAAILRRTQRSQADPADDAAEPEVVNLPVPIARPRPARQNPPGDGTASFAAQLMGQDGAKRGLRAGPAVIDTAKTVYNRTEWSGARDRRARKGGLTKTEI